MPKYSRTNTGTRVTARGKGENGGERGRTGARLSGWDVNFIGYRMLGIPGVSSCKNVGFSARAAGQRGAYIRRGCTLQQPKGDREKRNAEGGKGLRGKMGFYDAPFPSSSRPSPVPSPVRPFRAGRGGVTQGHVFTAATMRAREEPMYVHRDDIGIRRAEGHARKKRGGETVTSSRFSRCSYGPPVVRAREHI